MAARFKTKTHTLSGSPEALSTIFSSPHDEYVNDITMRALHANSGDVTWEDDGGSTGGRMQPGEATGWELSGKFIRTTEIFLNGTADDQVEITLIG